jgi:DNA-directed RNA polymerase specialized sigma24 family protein
VPLFDAGPDPGPAAMLSRPEILEAIKALGDGEKTSLAKIARLYAARTPYDGADLLQEAICRVLSGERNWPRGVPAILLLGGVIRSIAWQWRQKDLRHGSTQPDDVPTDPPQEWIVFLDEFVGAFADDPTAQAVLVAVMKGNKGQELLAVIEPILNNGRDAAGATTKATAADLERELERVLKKIRRRVEKHRREVGPI